MHNVVIHKIGLQRDFAAVVYLLREAQNPMLPPPYKTVYVYTVYIQYTYSHREVGEVGILELERGLEGQQSWVKNTNMTECISSL